MKAMNYVAQAERDLSQMTGMLHRTGKTQDALMNAIFVETMKRAVHFVMPDNGRILDDDLKGIMGQEIKLPFPNITVEYYVDENEILINSVPEADVYCPRRIILAMEKTPEEWARLFKVPRVYESTEGANQILIMAANQFRMGWCVLPCGWMMSSADWGRATQPYEDFKPYDITPLDGVVDRSTKNVKIFGKALPLFSDFAAEMTKRNGEQKALQLMTHDISIEVSAFLEFMEALSCSNVGIGTLQEAAKPSVNAKRVRDGKIPIYETKTLVIKAPGGKGVAVPSSSQTAASRNSPREHLRRGHIRIYPSGQRVWINNTVVNAGNASGRVDKTYKIIRT